MILEMGIAVLAAVVNTTVCSHNCGPNAERSSIGADLIVSDPEMCLVHQLGRHSSERWASCADVPRCIEEHPMCPYAAVLPNHQLLSSRGTAHLGAVRIELPSRQ